MNSVLRPLTLVAGVLGLVSMTARAADPRGRLDNWPQWRGPLATGEAPRGDPPLQWDEKTNVRWKVPLPGKGSATPIVWGDQVFVLTAVDTGRQADPADVPKPDPRFEAKTKPPHTYHQFLVLSFDRNTGKLRWKQVAAEVVPHEGIQPTHSYAAASPTTDGRRLYVSFGSRGVYAYDLAGKPLWKRDLGRMHTRYAWGEGTSPVVHGDTLVITWDQEADSFITALDAKTGETRWKVARDEPTSWATPLVVEHGGRTQVVVPGTNHVRSYDLADGRVLWTGPPLTINAIPCPVARGGVVYCMSGYRGAVAYALPLDGRGDVGDKFLWKAAKGMPYVPSPLLAGDRLYYTQSNDPLLTCLDAKTGKPLLDSERLPGLRSLYASPVAAAGRVYVTDRDGTTLVLRLGDKLEVLATNHVEDATDASPAVVGKQLFLRGANFLYCIEAP
jgi:outer membrane protein assembly factor BamB